MIHEQIATGTTVDAAFEAAIAQLNPPADVELKKEILEMPVKKTFGLFGGSPAKVRVSYEESPLTSAVDYFKNIIRLMGFEDAKVDVKELEQGLDINIECEDYGVLIGRRGETLDAIQYLTGLVANRDSEAYYRVSVNAGNYREKRVKTLEALASRVAAKVQRDGKSVTLEPMNPYERRVIHTAVQRVKGVESHSVGSENNRCVVISLAEGAKPLGDTRGGYRGNRPRGNGMRGNNGGRPGGYNRNRSYNNRPAQQPTERKDYSAQTAQNTEKPVVQEQKKDAGSAPLYGRID